MTPKQKLLHKSLVRAIHLSKRYREYFKDNKDEYKDLLAQRFGVDSSTKLSIEQLITFVDFMNFKSNALPTPRPKDDKRISEAQLKMIKSLWDSFASNKSDEALLQFANRQTRKTYLHLHVISKSEAQKIIPALKTMQKNNS